MTDISAYIRQNKAKLIAEIKPVDYDAIQATITTDSGPERTGLGWTLQEAFERALAPIPKPEPVNEPI